METKQYDVGELKKDIITTVRSYNPNANVPLIEKAIDFAHSAYKGQKRLSGEDFFIHYYNVAVTLAKLKRGSTTLAAGILQGTVEEANTRPEVLEREFGEEILSLILAVSKLKNVDKNFSPESEFERRAENIRKIMLASSKDIRVIIIKIADRLESMRTLKYLPDNVRTIIASEAMTIYAPIADKLGMHNVKAELEDLAFRFLENVRYLEIKNAVSKKKEAREAEINRIVDVVQEKLKEHDITAEVYGRAKHFYGIYKKLITKGKHFDEIYDLMAIRIITETVDECYKALGIIHNLWKPMPERLKDYIATPKANGYESIHTGVFIGHGSVLEVQIRTRDMHMAAEEGVASHWSYKGVEKDKKFDRHISLMKQILDWQTYSDNSEDFIESLTIDLFEKEIFAFTPQGDPIALPENATPVDFAYAVHTDIGNHCKQAKVNGVIVPLDYELSSGDVVEIITQKNAVPSRAWLSFAKSAHTRSKIRNSLNIEVDMRIKKREKEEPEEEEFSQEMIIEGKKYDIKIPKCCTPNKSDNIRAFKTKDGKVVVHKVDCPNVYTCDLTKEMKLDVTPETKSYPLRVDVKDRVGVLGELLNFIVAEKCNMESVNTRIGKDGRVLVTMDIERTSTLDIKELMEKLKGLDYVINVLIEDERHTNRFIGPRNDL